MIKSLKIKWVTVEKSKFSLLLLNICIKKIYLFSCISHKNSYNKGARVYIFPVRFGNFSFMPGQCSSRDCAF